MCCAVIDNFPRAHVKYQFTDRNNTIYPEGFAEELCRQIKLLENVVITEEEIEFMKRRCPYIPYWFYTFLRGFRYKNDWVSVAQDKEGRLKIEFEGEWSQTIMLEVKVLAIISELYHEMMGHAQTINLKDYYAKSYDKATRLLNAGCTFSDFGTRRRASFAVQDIMVSAMRASYSQHSGNGRFMGTSNVYLAMKYDLTPIGTMAHEFICAIAGMYGPQMANYLSMEAWANTYRGALGTYLYDTYGWEIFSLNFSEEYANMFKGLRVDSGDNFKELDKIIRKYRSLSIDPASKQVIFSNALNVDKAIELHNYSKGKCIPSFGIGTHFSNDFDNFHYLNIVIKLVAVKITEKWPFYCDTCKLSEDRGKYTGKPEVVARFMQDIHRPE